VAKVVGIGTGQTLRNKQKQAAKVKESPRAAELVPQLAKGEITLAQAAKEVEREERRARERERAEQRAGSPMTHPPHQRPAQAPRRWRAVPRRGTLE
jgi:hypothetical protein